MAKIVLGKRPEVIKRVVTFTLPDGSAGRIACSFKYRTRTEYGALIDRLADEARIRAEADAPTDADAPDAARPGVASIMGSTIDANATYLGEVLVGWDLDEPLGPQSLRQLCDELPAGAAAVMEGYRLAVVEGRLGN